MELMVFRKYGEDCGTDVASTRDPATGEKKFYGEYLINAQGEDVVAGIKNPQKSISSKNICRTYMATW